MDNVSENTPAQEPVPATDFKQRFKLSGLEILFGILILLGLIYVGYFILFQDSSGTASKLQKKISSMETSSREQVEKLDKMIKAIQDTEAQLDVAAEVPGSPDPGPVNQNWKIGKTSGRGE